MNKYRLLSGFHDDGDQVYEPGDIVESNIDLVSRFANKFVRVYPTEADSQVSEQSSPASDVQEDSPAKDGTVILDGSEVGKEVSSEAAGKLNQDKWGKLAGKQASRQGR